MKTDAEQSDPHEIWWKRGYAAAVYRQYYGHIEAPELESVCADAFARAFPRGIPIVLRDFPVAAPAAAPGPKTRGDFMREVIEVWDQLVKFEPTMASERDIAVEWLTKTFTVAEMAEPTQSGISLEAFTLLRKQPPTK